MIASGTTHCLEKNFNTVEVSKARRNHSSERDSRHQLYPDLEPGGLVLPRVIGHPSTISQAQASTMFPRPLTSRYSEEEAAWVLDLADQL